MRRGGLRRFLGSAVAAVVGWLAVAVLAGSQIGRVGGAVALVWLVHQRFVRGLFTIVRRKPEGGYLPVGIPRSARRVDYVLNVARIALRQASDDNDEAAWALRKGLADTREAAREAASAGHADAVREIVRLREPCDGPDDVQRAWKQLLQAALQGASDPSS